MSTLLSITILVVIVLTICVVAMTLALLLMSKLRQYEPNRKTESLLQNEYLDFTLRPCQNKKTNSTINRVDRRSIESFYWVPTSTISTLPSTKITVSPRQKQNAYSTNSVYFV